MTDTPNPDTGADDEYRSYMHEGGLSCPACDTAAEDGVLDTTEKPTHIATANTQSEDPLVRIGIGACGCCETPLHIVTESALPEAMGVDVCLEVPPEARDNWGDGDG